MPLDWLGQLSPTMQQQIALQRALLALQREDEQIRLKTMPQTEKPAQPAQPALARKLVEGPGPAIPGGPTFDNARAMEIYEGHSFTGTPSRDHFRPGAGSLEEALRAARPSPGYVSGEERSRLYKEKMYEEREVGAKEAFNRIVTLDPESQKVALNALRRFKSGVYKAMETEGYMSPAGMLVQPKQDIFAKESYVSEGWIHECITFADGTTTDEVVAPAPEEVVEGASPSDLIAMQRLGLDMAKYNSSLMESAFKLAEDVPREGLDTVTDEDGNERAATAQDEAIGLNRVMQIYNTLVATGGLEGEVVKGEATMSDVEREFNASSAEGKMAMQAKLGVPQTGEWDEPTAFAMETYGEILLGEKEPVKKPERESNIKTGGGLSGL